MGSSPTYENKISPQYRLGSFLDVQKKGVRLKVSGTQEDPLTLQSANTWLRWEVEIWMIL